MDVEQQDSVEAEAVAAPKSDEQRDQFTRYHVRTEATAAAENNAEAKVNERLWNLAVFTMLILGFALAYRSTPTPPLEQLIRKSPDYRDFYTDAYKAKVKSLRMKNALIGMIGGVIMLVAHWLGFDIDVEF